MRGPGTLALALLVAVTGPAFAVSGDPATSPAVDPLLRERLAAGPAVAIFVVDDAAYGLVVERLVALGAPQHGLPELSMVTAFVDAAQFERALATPGMHTAWANHAFAPYLSKSAPYVGATNVWRDHGVTGAGVTVMVVDTGIDGNHPDVEYGRNLVENVAPLVAPGTGLVAGSPQEGVRASDADGHGTHVAGIVGGTARGVGGADAGTYRGIAHGAELVGFQAGLRNPDTGEAEFETVTILEAFEYALRNRDQLGIRVVTNSWGGNGEFDPDDPVNVATLALYRAGLVVTFAAGNEGASGEGTLNLYCVAPWVLCVAAGDYANRRTSFSSIGTDPGESNKAYDHPDLMAPGLGITAAKASSDGSESATGGLLGGLLGGATPSAGYTAKSGTSMATPHVAGAAALLLEAKPDLSPDQVYDILVGSSFPLSDPVWKVGAGYLNVVAAHDLAVATNGTLREFLAGSVKYAGPLSGDGNYSRDPVSVGYGVGVQGAGRDASAFDIADRLVNTTTGLVFLLGTVLFALVAFRRGTP